MAIIDSVKLPDNSTYEVADNHSGYQKETLTTPLTINGTSETTIEGALGGLNDYGDALADNLAANENVLGAKNLWDIEGWLNKNNQSYTKSGSVLTIPTSADLSSNPFVFSDTNISVTLSVSVAFTASAFDIELLDTNNNVVGSLGAGTGTVTASGCKIRFNNPYIGQNVTLTDPMLRDARIIDSTFVPFAETNLQLTQNKAERDDLSTINITGSTNNTGSTIAKNTLFYLNGSLCRATEYILNGSTFTLNTNFKVTNIGGELYGESGTFTLTPTSGTYTDGFTSQTNNYVRVGGLCLIYGTLALAGNADISHSYVTCSGLPFSSNSIHEVGFARVANNGKVSSGVRHDGGGGITLYFGFGDGTYPAEGDVYQYSLTIRIY